MNLSSTDPKLEPKAVPSIRSIADLHSTFLLDMWGVMHDGKAPYPGVLRTVQELRSSGKRMVILSNSSKRRSEALRVLAELGFDDPAETFVDVITSGEVSHRMLSGDDTLRCGTWDVLEDLVRGGGSGGKRAFVLGSGNGDEDYVRSTGWTVVGDVGEADLIVARGTFTVHDRATGTVVSKPADAERYARVLGEALGVAAERRLPMLVTNPDRVRPDADLSPMPGSIADSYEALLRGAGGQGAVGGLVQRIGKPFPEVYDLAMRLVGGDGGVVGSVPDVVMVGDALETDVAGGIGAGCATLWVTQDGIHAAAVEEEGGVGEEGYRDGVRAVIRGFNSPKRETTEGVSVCPTYVTPHFQW